MSRIGNRPISIPNGVTISADLLQVTVNGPRGQLIVPFFRGLTLKQADSNLTISRSNDTKSLRSLHGTVRSLLQSAIIGVTQGFEKRLELVGIGYRAMLEGDKLTLQVGFTHPVKLELPTGIDAKVDKNVIIVQGNDKQQVGQFAAVVRSIKKPNPYKGKGIRYAGEKVRLKQGKTTKSGS